MWEKRTQYCWNDVLVLYLINRNYVVSFVINDMIAITVIFYLFLLSYGFDIFFVILNLNAFWKVWSVIFCNDFFQTFHVFFFSRQLFWTRPSIKFQVLLLEWGRGNTFIQHSTNHFFTSWYEDTYAFFSSEYNLLLFWPFSCIFPLIMPPTTCYFAV